MADVRFLGKPDIVGIGKTAPPASIEEWKRVAVLAYLCLNLPLRLHTDTDLASLLWPELNPALGTRRVAKAIQWLNSFTPETIIDSTRFGEYQALQTTFSVDVWAFRGGVRMKRYEDALTLYNGVVMDGVEFADAPDFMAWLGRQRTRYARLASLCAWRSYQQALERGDLSLATGLLLLAYERSPSPKPEVGRVMELLVSVGAPEEALRLFRRESEPSEAAQRLARQLEPGAQIEPPRERPSLVLGVAGLAVLTALAMLALPNRHSNTELPTAPVTEVEPTEITTAAAGGPLDPQVIWEVANQHLEARNYGQAETLFRLLTEHPELREQAKTASQLAAIYETIPGGDAVQLYDLVQQAPDDVFHMTEGPLEKDQFLGWIVAPHDDALARTHFQTAKERAEVRIAEDRNDPWGHRNLALAELGLGEPERATAALDQARTLASEDSPRIQSRLLEARAMIAGVGTEERRALVAELRSADSPWRPDSIQLATDPRWR